MHFSVPTCDKKNLSTWIQNEVQYSSSGYCCWKDPHIVWKIKKTVIAASEYRLSYNIKHQSVLRKHNFCDGKVYHWQNKELPDGQNLRHFLHKKWNNVTHINNEILSLPYSGIFFDMRSI